MSGKKFVNALRDMIENYGNVEDKFLAKINMIAEQSHPSPYTLALSLSHTLYHSLSLLLSHSLSH